MSYIVYGKQTSPFIHSDDMRDEVFGHGLATEEEVIDLMTEPTMHTNGIKNAEYTWFIFENGSLLPGEKSKGLQTKAVVAAGVLVVARALKTQEELKQKAAEAAKRQEVLDRQHYEVLHKRFGGAK